MHIIKEIMKNGCNQSCPYMELPIEELHEICRTNPTKRASFAKISNACTCCALKLFVHVGLDITLKSKLFKKSTTQTVDEQIPLLNDFLQNIFLQKKFFRFYSNYIVGSLLSHRILFQPKSPKNQSTPKSPYKMKILKIPLV